MAFSHPDLNWVSFSNLSILVHFAQGALVGPSPPGGGGGGRALAQGALVGAIEPGGRREVSGRVAGAPDDSIGLPVAHGAAVGPMGGARVLDPDVVQGALVPAPALGRALEDDGGPASGTTGRPCGPDVVWTVVVGIAAFGSRSKLKRDPKGKCCTTGNFDKTSALYILIIPLSHDCQIILELAEQMSS